MSETKGLFGVEIKSESLGQVTARFATYNEIDHHGDITRKGAFENGKEIVVSAYNHQSWGGMLPVGKARIRDGGDGVYADIQFLMSTQAGRETFETVKEMGSLQQWSYGFDIDKKSTGTLKSEDGDAERHVRYLEKVRVHEVSPVLLGAGKSTATIGVKMADKLEAAGYSIDDVIELLEEKAKKPKPKDDEEDDKKPGSKKPSDDKKPSSSDKPSKEDDEEEEDDDKKKPYRGRGKKPVSSGKMRMSDQTEDVVTSLKELADRAEEIVTLRKSQGKSGVSEALAEQFYDLLKEADRIFALCPQDDEGFFVSPEEANTKAAEDQQVEVQNIYLSLLSEEL